MSMLICPRCGASNGPLVRYCKMCGTQLSAGPTPAPQMGYAPSPAQPYYQYQYPANYWEVVRTGKINNTLIGLLLLVMAVLIAWIPFAGFIGGIIGFIGAILVLVGREPFGSDHLRNTTLAMIFFVVGITVTIFGFFYSIYYANSFGGGVVNLFSIVFVVGGAIFGLSEVLLTYSLQKSVGHELLWLAYAISIFVQLVSSIVAPFGTGGFWSIFFGTGVFIYTGLLGAIPAAIYGTAFYLARERIVRHEIPAPMTQQETARPPS